MSRLSLFCSSILSIGATQRSSIEAGPVHLDDGTLDLVVLTIITGREVVEFDGSSIVPPDGSASWLAALEYVSTTPESK